MLRVLITLPIDIYGLSTKRMQAEVEPEFAKLLVPTLMETWGLKHLRYLRTFENVVYVSEQATTCYLRLTSTKRRSIAQIRSELDVLQYLSRTDILATTPLTDTQGRTVVAIESGAGAYLSCVFSECPGSDVQQNPPVDMSGFWRNAGITMGRLHKATMQFDRPENFSRFDWQTDRWDRFETMIPRAEVEAWACYKQMVAWWKTLDRSAQNYGLIHGDFTVNNLRYNGSQISLFDFDGCCDHWYGYEIACFLHYFLTRNEYKRQSVFNHFMDGYISARPVDHKFTTSIEMFSRMKLLRSHMIIAEQWGFDSLTSSQVKAVENRRKLLRTSSLWG